MNTTYWLPSDAAIVEEVCAAFPTDERPANLTAGDDDPECLECDRFFRAHTPEDLPLEPVRNRDVTLLELRPEAVRYFLSAFVRHALLDPARNSDPWSGGIFIYRLRLEDVVESCTLEQRAAVLRFLDHVRHTRTEIFDENLSSENLDDVLELWRSRV